MNITLELLDAVEFASLAHQGQVRGGRGVPYVNHPIDVARRLINAGFDDRDTLIAAVLHDVVEDTHIKLTEISDKFGRRVAELVNHVTLPPEARKDRELKQKFQLRKMIDMDPHGQAIKIADKTSNVHDLYADPPQWGLRAIRGYSEASRAVVMVATQGNDSPLAALLVDPRVWELIVIFKRTYERVASHHGWNPAEVLPQ